MDPLVIAAYVGTGFGLGCTVWFLGAAVQFSWEALKAASTIPDED